MSGNHQLDDFLSAGLADEQVAEALASRGAVRASVSLLAALAQDALLEGWLSAAAGLLYRLLEISRPLVAVRFCHAADRGCAAPVSALNSFHMHTWTHARSGCTALS